MCIERAGGTWGKSNVEKCLNCQFYDRRNARPTDGRVAMWGQCRRHSPHLNPLSARSYLVEGVWPLIRDDDWCGEWKVSTQTPMSRARITPRTDEVSTAAMAAITAAADRSVPASAATVAIAGDD